MSETETDLEQSQEVLKAIERLARWAKTKTSPHTTCTLESERSDSYACQNDWNPRYGKSAFIKPIADFHESGTEPELLGAIHMVLVEDRLSMIST